MSKLTPEGNECVCGGFIISDGLDEEDNTPQYKCDSCGKRWYNEADL